MRLIDNGQTHHLLLYHLFDLCAKSNGDLSSLFRRRFILPNYRSAAVVKEVLELSDLATVRFMIEQVVGLTQEIAGWIIHTESVAKSGTFLRLQDSAGSIPMESLTAFLNPCWHPKYRSVVLN